MPYQSEKQRRFLHAKHPSIARRWDAEEKRVSKHQPRFGNGGAPRGRRMSDEDLHEPVGDNAVIKGAVGKSRFFDPEHRRQRRLGMAEAALGAGGLAGLALGGRGVVRSTKALRKTRVEGSGGKMFEVLGQTKQGKRLVAGKPRDLGLLGGGVAAGGGAIGVNRFAESRKGRGWN